MEPRANKRTQQTRERILAAAQKMFLQQGYLATSTDAVMAEAGIASKETLYRHYASKEELFTAVLGRLTVEQQDFAEKIASLPMPNDPGELRQALTELAHAILERMSQPEYLALLRITMAEAPRFPQLGSLFVSTVPQRGLTFVMTLLREARAREIIADVDLEAVARALLGGLLTYAITNMASAGEEVPRPSFDRADAIVEVIMRALVFQTQMGS
ncbi:MAG: TetR/AcrR family transcriptional regulator [Chloroflexi bacterium]|nr:TetR/AcrR family transcriptional regulator [Chloroflexota bacterium]